MKVVAWSRKKGDPKSSLTPFLISAFQRIGSQGELAHRNPETRKLEAPFLVRHVVITISHMEEDKGKSSLYWSPIGIWGFCPFGKGENLIFP
jgi:hypothetical protein